MQEKVLDDFSGVQNLRKNEIWWFSVSCSSLVASDSIESNTEKFGEDSFSFEKEIHFSFQ